ncbi:hypothetical protein [Acinetobacter sp. UC24323]|uniref:hypothetical protein n=1 Tax=Acinetobacter sp. UC24323 TaxID=2839946 RepID=UPI00209DE491|nr:hypothetical protein [Acinetobacter sp. UC24323]MCO9051114.1 hypothetical protein [Acinetobacter sp. UC24323]MDC4465949.1 hypothetical protein [Acinetobacter baumannii]
MGNNQKQDVKNNSTAVQAEVIENLTIENGLSPKEVEIYCLGLFVQNIYQTDHSCSFDLTS